MPKPTSDCRATDRKHPWPMVRLGDVCEVRAGANYRDVEDPNGRYPIYGTGGIMGRASQYRCPAHSVIVGRKGTLDNPYLVDEPFWNIDTCFGVVPSERIIPEYLFRFCQGFDFYSLVPASGRPSTTSDAVRAIEIPLPPLPVQREIVARLERELAAVEKMKKGFEALAETAKAEFKAELKEVFEELKHRGTETRRLGDVCECKKGPFGSALTKSMFVPRSDSAVKVYEQKNAIRKDATLGSYYITRQYFDAKMRSFEVKPADIIISCAGTIGETYILPSGCEQGVINQALMRVRTCSCLDKLFFLFFFETILNVVNDSSNGSAMKNIPPFKIFKAFEIPVPSLDDQCEVVARLDLAKARAEKLEAKAREGVAVCETMRKAILKEAFE